MFDRFRNRTKPDPDEADDALAPEDELTEEERAALLEHVDTEDPANT